MGPLEPLFSGTPVPQVGREVGRVYGNEVNWLWPSGRRRRGGGGGVVAASRPLVSLRKQQQ